MSIAEILKAEAHLIRSNAKGLYYSGLADLIVREGRFYHPRPLPKHMVCGPPRECFRNALHTVIIHPLLTYCEGYAINPLLGFPMQHAWVVDSSGAAIDVTWKYDERIEYFGICFPIDEVSLIVLAKGTYGVLEDVENGFPALHYPYTPGSLAEYYRNRNLGGNREMP